MPKYLTLVFSVTVLGLLTLITFASGQNLAELSTFFGSLFNITLYSPFDNTPILIKNSYLEVGGHFFIFLLVGLVLRQWLIEQSIWLCLITLSVIAGSSELGQMLAIGRGTSWDDFIINLVAGSIGLFVSNAFSNHREIPQAS